ncbi:hypothetical protein GPECTOR_10g935 [Gonium pectorale]|uniref:Uncharacterized protein n=1 Tax=Gonium pectorale TaxID=33097 RepID=A0A150GR90_GONPE|nr:hypothetical protein GPECTOR_10g935 [Gonium pectorale]|eukprot:KXZ52303.1 hypothetical protein GPECTOR_10g935 [Gonium pectorale]
MSATVSQDPPTAPYGLLSRAWQGFKTGSILGVGAAAPPLALLTKAPAPTILRAVGVTALVGTTAGALYGKYEQNKLAPALEPERSGDLTLAFIQALRGFPPSANAVGSAAGLLAAGAAAAAARFHHASPAAHSVLLLGGAAVGCAASVALEAVAPKTAEKIQRGSATAYQAVVPYAYAGFTYGALFGIATACVTKTRVECIYSTLGRAASASGLAGAGMGGAYGAHARFTGVDVPEGVNEEAARLLRDLRSVCYTVWALLVGASGTSWWIFNRMFLLKAPGPTLPQAIALAGACLAVLDLREMGGQTAGKDADASGGHSGGAGGVASGEAGDSSKE